MSIIPATPIDNCFGLVNSSLEVQIIPKIASTISYLIYHHLKSVWANKDYRGR